MTKKNIKNKIRLYTVVYTDIDDFTYEKKFVDLFEALRFVTRLSCDSLIEGVSLFKTTYFSKSTCYRDNKKK